MNKRSYSTELQIWTPEKKRESSSSRKLTILPSSSHGSTSFTLPRDWFVDRKVRTCGAFKGAIYKYYHEPGTGRKFRSLASVKRHLEEMNTHGIREDVSPLSLTFPGVDDSSKCCAKPGSFMKTLQCKSASQIVVYRRRYVPKHKVNIDKYRPVELPDGWFIKTSVRRSGHSMSPWARLTRLHVFRSQYYCEQATGRVFRSLVDVQRYLADNSIEENTTLSKLLKPAGLVQMPESGVKIVNNASDMAIVPHSSNEDSYSDHSDDVLLKDMVTKFDNAPFKDSVLNADDVPLKHLLVRKSADVQLKDLVRKSKGATHKDLVQNADYVLSKGIAQRIDDVPHKDLVRKSKEAPVKVLVQQSDDVPLRDFVRKSSNGKNTKKYSDETASPAEKVFGCTSNMLPVIAPNHPYKIKWVLNGPGGDDWCPFTNNMMVPESLKQEWANMFAYIVSQNYHNGSSLNALD